MTAPPATANVEVMLAHACYDSMGLPCGPGIAWPGLLTQPPGAVYELDHDERTLEPYSGKQLRIRTRPGSGNVDRLVLLAFGPDGALLGLARVDDPPLTSPDQEIRIDIPQVDDVTIGSGDPPNAADGALFRAHVWRPQIDPSEASCASTQTWDDAHFRWLREFYVPPHDHDCDQREPLDCAPDWADYSPMSPGTQSPYCTHTTPAFPRACAVGIQTCVDGISNTDCTESTRTQCVPDEMCDECPLLAPGCGAAMIEEQLIHDASKLTFSSCDFSYDDNNGNMPCTSNNGDTLDLALPITCTGIGLYKNDWPPTSPVSLSTLTIGSASIQVAIKKMAPCSLELKFGGTAPIGLPAQRYVLAIVNGNAEIELPFSIRFSPSCQSNGSRTCSMPNSSDGMWSCATQ